MRSPAKRITFEPPNSFPVLAWADDVAIRFILVLVVLIGGSWSEVFSAAVFNEQISTSETSTTGEQTTDGDKRGRNVGGDQAVLCNKPPKTLLEAITRNKGDRDQRTERITTPRSGSASLAGGKHDRRQGKDGFSGWLYLQQKQGFIVFRPRCSRSPIPCRDARRVARSGNWREFFPGRIAQFLDKHRS